MRLNIPDPQSLEDPQESSSAFHYLSTKRLRQWRYRIFVVTWLAYAGYYLCRMNFSVVMPLLERTLAETNLDLANIIFAYSLFYAFGQFCSGILSDRFGSRKIVGIGLSIVILSNVAMGFQNTVTPFIILGCVSGAAQSTGWSGLVKNMACWFRREERGVVMGWWGTNYVLGGFAATVFATFAVTQSFLLAKGKWRLGFWMPAVLLSFIALLYVVFVRNQPSDAGLPELDTEESALQPNKLKEQPQTPTQSWEEVFLLFRKLASDRAMWIMCVSFFLVKLTRYAFLFWLPIYMTQQLHYSVGDAGYTSSLYPLVGFLGALIAGYASDKLFQARRFPVCSLMLLGLALACLIHPTLAQHGLWGSALGISLIGIMTYGPDTMLSGAAAQDMGSQRGAATAAGLVDGVGSLGQLCSPYLVAIVSKTYGWNSLFYLFVLVALIGSGLLALRWNYLPPHKITEELESAI